MALGVSILLGLGDAVSCKKTAQVGCEWYKARSLHLLLGQLLLLQYEPCDYMFQL